MERGMDLSDATVGQLLIPVEDLDRAIAFYRDTLGLRFLFSAPPRMNFFQAGNVRLLVGVPEAAPPSPAGIHGLLPGRRYPGRVPDAGGTGRPVSGEPPGRAPYLHDRAVADRIPGSRRKRIGADE